MAQHQQAMSVAPPPPKVIGASAPRKENAGGAKVQPPPAIAAAGKGSSPSGPTASKPNIVDAVLDEWEARFSSEPTASKPRPGHVEALLNNEWEGSSPSKPTASKPVKNKNKASVAAYYGSFFWGPSEGRHLNIA